MTKSPRRRLRLVAVASLMVTLLALSAEPAQAAQHQNGAPAPAGAPPR